MGEWGMVMAWKWKRGGRGGGFGGMPRRINWSGSVASREGDLGRLMLNTEPKT